MVPPLADETVDTTPAEAGDWPVKRYWTAGGVVVRQGRVLLLQRSLNRGVRLPKGHVERGETAEEAAIREVQEETGLRHPTIVAPLGTVENRFAHEGHRWLRRETWFLMAADDLTCDVPERQWTPTWYAMADAEPALTYEAERVALRWAAHAAARRRQQP